jgi:acyl transferase domain-containing protein/SAM-dependent methyltransferase/acyl carrier protein
MKVREPIAIVGMGCRLPGGASSPETFWRLLEAGRDAITEIPSNRWDTGDYFDESGSTPGKCAARWGGFLGEVDGFDAGFFRIGAREAAHMDPQHRLLMEVTWEALEEAGIPAERLAGSETGVFVGMYTDDYRLMHLARKDRIDAYSGTGTIHTMAANRISYLLDLRGPSMAVDATCASSLVAVHLACESLAREECDLAIAGAVNLILSPLSMLAAAKVAVMAADGRCKSFDSRADGIVRGEGCGVLILKRLSHALAHGDPVCAVIEGSAVNQDGRSNGMTAPNPEAQEEVIRRALECAGLAPEQIQYVEAHGTGTPLGDPIEMEALARVFPQGLRLGSVKTNLGHLEAAAGMAGLIKTALALKHGRIPAHLHLNTLSPAVAEFADGFVIPTSLVEWPWHSERHRAGVSAFSLGGTNAHVVLSAAPATQVAPAPGAPQMPILFPVSAASQEALCRRGQEHAEWLNQERSAEDFADAGYTAAVRRTHHRRRLAVVAATAEAAAEKLAQRLAGVLAEPADSPGIAFVFAGQGARWSGVGRELFRSNAAFRESLLRSDEMLTARSQWSLIGYLEDGAAVRPVAGSQAAILAIQLAMVDMLESFGLHPAAVIGHSLGEAAAACVSGVLGRREAIEMLLCRGELSQRIAGQGKMAAVGLGAEEAGPIVEQLAGRVCVAAINSECSVVLSGDAAAMDRVEQQARRDGFSFTPLVTDCAFHSSQVRPLVSSFIQSVRHIKHQTPSLDMYSTVTGRRVQDGEIGPAHWGLNLAEPVLFSDAIMAAIDDGYRHFLEIGPSAALTPHVRELLNDTGVRGCTPSLLRGRSREWESVLRAVGDLYESGHDIQWSAFYPVPRRLVSLPLYPWQRRRFWLEEEVPDSLRSYQTRPAAWAWHEAAGDRILSAGGMLDAVLDALGDDRNVPVRFDDFHIHAKLTCRDGSDEDIRTSLRTRPDGAIDFTIASSQNATHAEGVVRVAAGEAFRFAASLPMQGADYSILAHQSEAGSAALLDDCLRAAACSQLERHGPAIVAGIDLVIIDARARQARGLRYILHGAGEHAATIDFDALDAEGWPVVQVRGVRLRHTAQPGIDDCIYEMVWEPREIGDPTGAARILLIYTKAAPRIEAYCAELAAEVLRKRPSRASPRYEALLARLADIAGRIKSNGSSSEMRRRLQEEFPELDPEMDLLARCADALPDVLAGRADPLEVIFTPGRAGPGPADRVYRESPFARYWNEVVRRAVVQAVGETRSGSRIRILEVGAGTGGTTAALLPHLQGRNVDYWFTDIGAWFLSRARKEFGEYPFVQYTLFDFERDAEAQGFKEKDFDVVVAANCLHATGDISGTLKRLRRLMRREGVLILLEGTSNRAWADMTFGSTEGWFHSGESPLGPDEWRHLLVKAGWEDVRGLAGDSSTVVIMGRSGQREKSRWMVLGNSSGLAGKISAAFRAGGEEIQYADTPSKITGGETEPAGVLDCRYADSNQESVPCARMAIEMAQAMASRNWSKTPQLWLVTRGSYAPGSAAQLGQSAVNGAALVIFTEHPELAGGVIDLAHGGSDDAAADRIRAIVRMGGGETEWSLRDGAALVPRLKRRPAPSHRVSIRAEATYLITGGTGGMGLHMAEWLARAGARRIVLVGRRQRPELARRLDGIRALGAEVSVRPADVAVRDQMERVIGEIEDSGYPLRGVIHAAGMVHDSVIANLTTNDLTRVFRPKVDGAWILHELTGNTPLDFFLLCSSAATLIGMTGLCAYAAANAYLDALAQYRHSIGLPAQAIDWGGWKGTGMAERVGGGREHQWKARGLYTMEPKQALEVLELVIGWSAPRISVMKADWKEFRSPLFEALKPKAAVLSEPPKAAASGATLLERLHRAAISERPDLFFTFLRDQLARLLADSLPEKLDPGESMLQLGLDSLMAVELRNSLAGALGVILPATSIFDYPTPETLLRYAARLAGLELPESFRQEAAIAWSTHV